MSNVIQFALTLWIGFGFVFSAYIFTDGYLEHRSYKLVSKKCVLALFWPICITAFVVYGMYNILKEGISLEEE